MTASRTALSGRREERLQAFTERDTRRRAGDDEDEDQAGRSAGLRCRLRCRLRGARLAAGYADFWRLGCGAELC